MQNSNGALFWAYGENTLPLRIRKMQGCYREDAPVDDDSWDGYESEAKLMMAEAMEYKRNIIFEFLDYVRESGAPKHPTLYWLRSSGVRFFSEKDELKRMCLDLSRSDAGDSKDWAEMRKIPIVDESEKNK